MINIKPLGKNVLVELVEKETITSNIVLPDSEKEETPQIGKVVAIGSSKDIYPEIKKGIAIVFRQFSGDKVIFNDTEYVVLDAEKDVVAVIDEK